MTQLWDVPVGKTPAGVLWHDGKLLVADMGTDYLVEVDPADGHELRRIVTGKGAHNLFLSPDGKVLWVNNRVGGTTTELDAKTLMPFRSFRISGGPDDLAFAPDGKVWITRRFAEPSRSSIPRQARSPTCPPAAPRTASSSTQARPARRSSPSEVDRGRSVQPRGGLASGACGAAGALRARADAAGRRYRSAGRCSRSTARSRWR